MTGTEQTVSVVSVQLSLLDQLPTGPDRSFRTAQRRNLGNGAWLDHAPDWLRGQDDFKDRLVQTASWETHQREMYERIVQVPRLVAGVPGSVSGSGWNEGAVRTQISSATADEIERSRNELALMSTLLSVRYGRCLDSVTLAYYRDGSDSVAYHGDKMGVLRPDTVVAIVSVGCRRHFLLREVAGRGSARFLFGGGDLLVMGGSCQETWEHAVPKMKAAGPRVAIMFRERIPQTASAAAKPGLAGKTAYYGAGATRARPRENTQRAFSSSARS